VYKRPVIAILSTGNEIVDLHAETPVEDNGWGGIFDTNRPSLQATLQGMGYEVVDLGIVPDTLSITHHLISHTYLNNVTVSTHMLKPSKKASIAQTSS
jgi:molybdopterin biosynthesis enzyme